MNKVQISNIFLICLLSGCASFSETFTEHPDISESKSRGYSGVKADATIITNCGFHWEERCQLTPFAVLDFPFSAVADTLLLPYTIFSTDKIKEDRVERNGCEPNIFPQKH